MEKNNNMVARLHKASFKSLYWQSVQILEKATKSQQWEYKRAIDLLLRGKVYIDEYFVKTSGASQH